MSVMVTECSDRLEAIERDEEIEQLRSMVFKWQDETSRMMSRAMIAELAAARIRLKHNDFS